MYLQFHSVKEPSKNLDIKGSVQLFSGSVLGKTWVLVRFILAEFEFFSPHHGYACTVVQYAVLQAIRVVCGLW